MPTAKKKRTTSTDVNIPEKLYFRIGEVAELAKLEPYVLRFWETEFPQLKPTKSSTGQRMYRRRDVENVLTIKRLLYEEGFTIAGAREKLKADAKVSRQQPPLPFLAPTSNRDGLKRVRAGLEDILKMLSARPRA
ncbi:MAG TPA: MerR family transcriptional regulator [Candidatus Acidoferrales bacterium]|nr:MerR family transcriptional regulator [Candidatus Acidoferrales bacterium]